MAAAALHAPDVTIVVNNAGATTGASFLDSPIANIRREFDINFFGAHSVAVQALDGIENDAIEVLADELTQQVKAGLEADPAALYSQLARQ
ncbi:hypothetical protein ACIO14_27870 [Nocardia fluminea]|uniref:hypothetical protein n=1 Tax=Nocardia fluminea TaxID=134984 RepID=UPI0038010A0D